MTDRYLACTLIGEARGEPIDGQVGVASAIRNRAIAARKPYKDICLAKNQFSCWNNNDPNFTLIQKVYSDLENGNSIIDPYLRQCIAVARCVQEMEFLDNTKGAKNYVTIERYGIATARQNEDKDGWILRLKQSVTLGNHIFLVEK